MTAVPRVLIAGDRSSAGKTTLATGIMSLLADHRAVQPFKVGLDYIDTSYHTMVTGRASGNLDGFLMDTRTVRESFAFAAAGADIAVIEGVRGLFEGLDSRTDTGSTAQVARALAAPVILVIDARSITRSAAAIVKGFQAFDPGVDIRGVILNKIGSTRHGEKAADAIEAYTGAEVLGTVPRDASMGLTMRHLGLVPAREGAIRIGDFRERIDRVRAVVRETVDVGRIEEIAREAPPLADEAPLVFREENMGRPRIGVALDEAFNFYYRDNLELLRLKGAEIVTFSPLHDARLPPVDGVIIGGGYPEFFAPELSGNESMREDIREASSRGMPIYGECGGLMYLARELELENGEAFPMAGALDGRAAMRHVRTIGYVCGEMAEDTPAGPLGLAFRGHEFHHSVLEGVPPGARFAYRLSRGHGIAGGMDGLMYKNTIGAYTHLHAAGCPEHTRQFIGKCLQYNNGGGPVNPRQP